MTTTDQLALDADQSTGQAVEALNHGCFCISLDRDALRQSLDSALGEPDLSALIEQRCPFVFSARPVFVSAFHIERMQQLVRAVESVIAMPAYRAHVLANAAPIAQHDPRGAKGVFYGYDFHLHQQNVALIEINTNSGGAMLNAVLAKAQRACCDATKRALPILDAVKLEQDIVAMFLSEWHLCERGRPLRTIAIVDEAPQDQYLYPEFLLFQQLFERHGLHTVIAGPKELTFNNGALWHGETLIDLVYNRLTDFMLEEPHNAALRDAYLANAVVLTPHPQAHALYASKRNLALLTDQHQLSDLGVPEETQNILLAGIPRTEIVKAADAERLWAERRKLFFKPMDGFGSRAVYRGDKLTKRVWEDILAGAYIAQTIVTPTERAMSSDRPADKLKFDLRAYVYEGEVQWFAARLYQGQTTNFRTPGGGFAPVYKIDGTADVRCS